LIYWQQENATGAILTWFNYLPIIRKEIVCYRPSLYGLMDVKSRLPFILAKSGKFNIYGFEQPFKGPGLAESLPS